MFDFGDSRLLQFLRLHPVLLMILVFVINPLIQKSVGTLKIAELASVGTASEDEAPGSMR